MSHTSAILDVSQMTFLEVSTKLAAAGYDYPFMPGGELDMSGIALRYVNAAESPENLAARRETIAKWKAGVTPLVFGDWVARGAPGHGAHGPGGPGGVAGPVDDYDPEPKVQVLAEPTPGLVHDELSADIARLMECRRMAHRAAAGHGVEILAIGRNLVGDAYQLTLRHRETGATVTNEVDANLTPALAAWRVGVLCGELDGDPRAKLASPEAVERAVSNASSPAEARLIRKWGPVCTHGVYMARCARCSAEPVTAEPPDTAAAETPAFKKGDRAFWRGSRLPTSSVVPNWTEEVARSDREVLIRKLGPSGPVEVSVIDPIGVRFDPSVAPSLLEPLPAWHVGQRARWAIPALPGGGTRCCMPLLPERTAEQLEFDREIGRNMNVTLLVIGESGSPTLARSDDGFEFDPSVDISCLRHIPPPAQESVAGKTTTARDPRLSPVRGGTSAGPDREVRVSPDGYGVDIVPKAPPMRAAPAASVVDSWSLPPGDAAKGRHVIAIDDGRHAAPRPLSAGLSSGLAIDETGGPVTRAGRLHDTFRSDVARGVGLLATDTSDADIVHAVVTLRIERDEARDHSERMRVELEQRLAADRSTPDAILLAGAEADAYRAFQSASIALEDAHRGFQQRQREHVTATALLGRASTAERRAAGADDSSGGST